MDDGLVSNEYYLVVARLEPENHVLTIIEGFVASASQRKLVIVGDDNSGTHYVDKLTAAGDERVCFMGSVYDHEYLMALRWHCRAYFHGHSVGGTNPSLLEAMACGNYVVAHDNVFNREVTAGNASLFLSTDDITEIVEWLDKGVPNASRNALLQRVREVYDWDKITDQYQALLDETCAQQASD